ncbi:MAG: peptidylprolyl isomerase [Bacteroidota bacterium]
MKPLFFIISTLLLLSHCARPIAQLQAPREARAGEAVTFTNESKDATAYSWDFGDGTTTAAENPAHRFLKSGEYEVVLTATNEQGRSKKRKQRISILPPARCLVYIQTPEGNMIAQLYDETPKHQDNFTKLVEENYYDSLLFHRVIDGFMVQGGDPNSRDAGPSARLGSGGPGYMVDAEFNPNLIHKKGALAAARNNNPQRASSGSQFYIVEGRPVDDSQLNRQEGEFDFRYSTEMRELYKEVGGTPFLDMNYTVFGQVVDGLDVIDRITARPTDGSDRPREDVWMKISLIK